MPTVVALSIHLKNTRDMSDRNIDMYTALYTVQLSAVINREGNFCHITMDFMTCALTFFWANCAMCMSLITNILVLYEVPNFLWFALLYNLLYNTVVWSSLGHPLGSTQKVPCRRQCLTGGPFIHCKLAKWEQPKGALQAKVPYRGGALQGHDHCSMLY